MSVSVNLPFGPTAYVVAGSINAMLMSLCFVGVYFQFARIRQRRRDTTQDEAPTELLSARQFSSSFLGAFAFFVFGYSSPAIDHFLVWPRLASAILCLAIVWEICRDRHIRSLYRTAIVLSTLLVVGMCGLLVHRQLGAFVRQSSTALLLGVACLIAYGYAHQISLIWKKRHTGALSLRMNQFILAMDVSTLAFAFAIGIHLAWAMALVATVSAVTKIIVLCLFRWVKRSQDPG